MESVEAVSVASSANGVIAASVKHEEATGAGAWVSVHDPKHGNVWKPALIPKTIQMNNPVKDSIHRIVDVIVRDPNTNKPVMHPDPAALAYVRAHWKDQPEQHDWIPVMAFNEAKEPIRESVNELKSIIVEQNERQIAVFKMLADALSGKATPPDAPAPSAPKRRGRPPKVKEN